MATVIAVAVLLHVPLGDHMARVYTCRKHFRVERVMYRLIGADPGAEQSWGAYARSLLALSAVGAVVLYGLLMSQRWLPEPWGRSGMTPAVAFNTAISFVTNTSWQNYAGEAALGHVGLVAGLGVQAFVSAAVGMCVAVALIRGLVGTRGGGLGNFWVDLVRTVTRILLPIAVVTGVILLGAGVIANFAAAQQVGTVAGGIQTLPGGPVAAWEPIKLMSGDGGGAFNVNSAHPFENPSPTTNVVEIVTMLLLPLAMIRTFGVMSGDRRQGWVLFGVVGVLYLLGLAALMWAQAGAYGTVATAVGAAAEGTESRFGPAGAAVFGHAATASGDGAANAAYDSFTSAGGAVLMLNMMLGEVAPGGPGSGLYGLVVMALLAVFVGGLMVGTTPTFLGKRLEAPQMRLVSLYVLVLPAAVLFTCALAMALPDGRAAMLNSGPHGLSEVLYAVTSSAANNGSAFAGFTGNTTFFNILLAVAMMSGRFLPIILVMALAGSLAGQRVGASTAGTLDTRQMTFAGLLVGVIVLMVGLDYLPGLALGPGADALR